MEKHLIRESKTKQKQRGLLQGQRTSFSTPNDLLSCFHNALQGLVAGNGAGAVPHGDAAGQGTLNGASIKRLHNRGWAFALLSFRRK